MIRLLCRAAPPYCKSLTQNVTHSVLRFHFYVQGQRSVTPLSSAGANVDAERFYFAFQDALILGAALCSFNQKLQNIRQTIILPAANQPGAYASGRFFQKNEKGGQTSPPGFLHLL